VTAERRVLVLAYFFPPLGGAGVQRTLKTLKYLPEHGWRSTVVTTASQAYPVSDPSLLDEIPSGTRVVRAAEPAVWGRLLRLVLMACDLLRLRALRGLVAWPDEMLGWGPFAFAATLREVRRSRPDVLYSTSAPYTAHLVAWGVHRVTGIPWVADFRDEWSNNPHGEQPPLVRRLNRLVERAITRAAARITVVADYFDMAGAPPDHVTVIPNGVDEDDLDGVPPPAARPDRRLRLSHVGTLYGDRDCAPVLAAMRRLVDAGRLDRDDIELRIVGNDWLAGLQDRVAVGLSRTGYVDHRAAVTEMRQADALLFYVAPTSLAPSGKIFEYLASERPILCVAHPDNLAARLVREWDAGIWAAPGDGDAIERALLTLVERRRAGDLPASPEVRRRTLERYSRRALAGRLAAVLEEAAAGAQP
jgi:glycosyltransferase involved in cell wall biosynthesis